MLFKEETLRQMPVFDYGSLRGVARMFPRYGREIRSTFLFFVLFFALLIFRNRKVFFKIVEFNFICSSKDSSFFFKKVSNIVNRYISIDK